MALDDIPRTPINILPVLNGADGGRTCWAVGTDCDCFRLFGVSSSHDHDNGPPPPSTLCYKAITPVCSCEGRGSCGRVATGHSVTGPPTDVISQIELWTPCGLLDVSGDPDALTFQTRAGRIYVPPGCLTTILATLWKFVPICHL